MPEPRSTVSAQNTGEVTQASGSKPVLRILFSVTKNGGEVPLNFGPS